jgi:hypothetical protein
MWLGFGEALAAVAGALAGLLFVAVSVMSDALAASLSLRSRAAQTLVLFMTSVLVGVAGLTFLLKAGGGLYWLIPPRSRACWVAWSTRGCSWSG